MKCRIKENWISIRGNQQNKSIKGAKLELYKGTLWPAYMLHGYKVYSVIWANFGWSQPVSDLLGYNPLIWSARLYGQYSVDKTLEHIPDRAALFQVFEYKSPNYAILGHPTIPSSSKNIWQVKRGRPTLSLDYNTAAATATAAADSRANWHHLRNSVDNASRGAIPPPSFHSNDPKTFSPHLPIHSVLL